MVLWIFPAIAWAVRGTVISFWDMLLSVKWPLASSIVAVGFGFAVRSLWGQGMSTLPRLILESTIMLAAYLAMLLFVTGQRAFYLDLIRTLKGSSSAREKEILASA